MNNLDVERIDSYLNKDMSEEDNAAFEAELTVNKELASAVALYRSIESTMRRNEQDIQGEDALRATLQDLGAVYFANKVETSQRAFIQLPVKPINPFPFSKLAIAASITVIVALGIVFYSMQKNKDTAVATGNAQKPKGINLSSDTAVTSTAITSRNVSPVEKDTQKTARQNVGIRLLDKGSQKALFARYFHPDTPPKNHDDFLNEAFDHYKKEEYTKAITAFDDVASAPLTRGGTSNEELTIFQARYYQAMSYLAEGNTAKAIARLKQLSAPDAFSRTKTKWYLALAYLKEGQSNAAMPLLVRLSQDKAAGEYRQQSQQIIKTLSGLQP